MEHEEVRLAHDCISKIGSDLFVELLAFVSVVISFTARTKLDTSRFLVVYTSLDSPSPACPFSFTSRSRALPWLPSAHARADDITITEVNVSSLPTDWQIRYSNPEGVVKLWDSRLGCPFKGAGRMPTPL